MIGRDIQFNHSKSDKTNDSMSNIKFTLKTLNTLDKHVPSYR